ncbi:winged helix-turn-helix domain-containing protein [Halobacterium rubrum]|uniref:winged helix-turn-helix domain-containing protein n=1 Tax=Halobacterium TaxID=2239 RepID=UPI001F32AAC7|nr:MULTISPECIES: winged helix-turn-helix domain-containing protein [Halobacterium]MDH5019264.1 winged helix-turn-helix domain-containing protein [Halobacterium rubrum]
MKLAVPTDFEVLEALSDGKRNNAVNISHMLDKNRAYINTRLPVLADYGLVERVGPASNSGLYEITEKGQVVVEHREVYEESVEDFEEFVAEKLEA